MNNKIFGIIFLSEILIDLTENKLHKTNDNHNFVETNNLIHKASDFTYFRLQLRFAKDVCGGKFALNLP